MESGSTTVVEGQGAQLVCSVSGTPLPTVVWLREESDAVFEEENEGVGYGGDANDDTRDDEDTRI